MLIGGIKLFKTKYKRWENYEIDYLIENYNKKSYKELAKELNRDERQVRNKIFYERKATLNK